jgi:hypothetical protein
VGHAESLRCDSPQVKAAVPLARFSAFCHFAADLPIGGSQRAGATNIASHENEMTLMLENYKAATIFDGPPWGYWAYDLCAWRVRS